MYGRSRYRVQSRSYKSEKRVAPKQQWAKAASENLITTVLFPHKLFQEYLAGMYLASLYISFRNEFDRIMDNIVLPRAEEFRYVLYFTVLKGRDQSTNIIKGLLTSNHNDANFVVDVAFESQEDETAAIVNRHLRSNDKDELTIGKDTPSKSTHTVFGYLSIRKNLVSHSNFTHESNIYPHLHLRV